MSDLLQDAMTAKESGNSARAKQLISQALIQSPRNEAAWMMMADVVDDVRLKRNCLERVLAINPDNTTASTMLAKLNTSPLTPITRGERDKPVEPPKIEKTPAFTPPFTWEGDQRQFQALGDTTFPATEEEQKPGDETPTFDWANNSAQPDKTINRLFDAVSNPELASQPPPDTGFHWEDKSFQDEDADSFTEEEGKKESLWLNELVGAEEENTPVQPLATQGDYSVDAEPHLGLDAFTSPEQSLESITADYRLWENTEAKTDRIIILNNQALLLANPKQTDVPHILGLFAENKLMRDLLGENVITIKLDDIRSLTVNPRRRTLSIEYKNKENRITTREVKLQSSQVLNEILESLQLRLGAGYKQNRHTFGLFDKITPPLITMLFIAVLGWLLISGLSMLSTQPAFQAGNLPLLISSITSFVSAVGVDKVFLVALLLFLLSLIWLLSNLRQPSELIVLSRRM